MRYPRRTVLTIRWDPRVSAEEAAARSREWAKTIASELSSTESVRMLVLKPGRLVWTQQEILQAIRDFNAEHGRPPKSTEWQVPGDHPNTRTVSRQFGSWKNAIEAAGFARSNRGRPSGVTRQYFEPKKALSLDAIYKQEMLNGPQEGEDGADAV